MLNYIKAELYRNFNRKYFWVYTVGIAILSLILNILLFNYGTNVELTMLFEALNNFLTTGLFLVLPMIDMTTAEEQKNQTLKNVVSFGISRNKLVLSKIVTAVILGIISVCIILTVFLGSGAILLGIGEQFSINILNDFILRLLVSIILWIAAISVGTFLAFFFKNSTVFAFVYAGVFFMIRSIISLLELLVSDKFKCVKDILITTQFRNLSVQSVTNDTLIFASVVGLIYIIIFTILTMLYVKKMEVK
ncbi:ABC transporter permease [Clostridium aestuarii]|uniref:ABC transporter permease n=1 Tax=Clostridium aestuarii TaxID=338193 RepID=A0ABT4D131_9CLOT|nr:ABC transporter permease [Clostridium aestuarii]MCY6484950.1 ABC transporter permease [Clostridium aestuarii]